MGIYRVFLEFHHQFGLLPFIFLEDLEFFKCQGLVGIDISGVEEFRKIHMVWNIKDSIRILNSEAFWIISLFVRCILGKCHKIVLGV